MAIKQLKVDSKKFLIAQSSVRTPKDDTGYWKKSGGPVITLTYLDYGQKKNFSDLLTNFNNVMGKGAEISAKTVENLIGKFLVVDSSFSMDL